MKNNLGFKILAVVIALIIWVQLNLLKEQSITMNIPLRIINVPENLYVDKSEIIKLKLQVYGAGIDVLSYYLSNPHIDYDASVMMVGRNALAEEKIIPFLRRYNNLKFALLEEVDRINIIAERIVQKTVTVHIDFDSIEAKEYFAAQQLELSEKSILLSGPVADIRNIEHATTEPISVAMIKGNKKVRFEMGTSKVLVIPPHLSFVKNEQPLTTKTFVNIEIDNPDNNIVMFPSSVAVIIEGNKDIIETIKSSDIQARVNRLNSVVEVRLLNHTNVDIIDFTPRTVILKAKEDI